MLTAVPWEGKCNQSPKGGFYFTQGSAMLFKNQASGHARTQLFQTVYKVHSQCEVGIMWESGTWDPSTREMKAGGPRGQGHSWL